MRPRQGLRARPGFPHLPGKIRRSFCTVGLTLAEATGHGLPRVWRGRGDALLRVRRRASGSRSGPLCLFSPLLSACSRSLDIQRRTRGSASPPRGSEPPVFPTHLFVSFVAFCAHFLCFLL